MKAFVVILIVLAAVLALLLLASFYFFRAVFCRGVGLPSFLVKRLADPFWDQYAESMKAGADWFRAQPYETVSIRSRDGLKLHGKFLPAEEESNRTILLFHGYRSYGLRDFSCIFQHYHEMGLNILLIDERAHGESEGKYLTLGVKERFDCLDWARYAADRFGPEHTLLIGGISMGTAVVLMASSLGLPENVRGMTADCGFTSPKEIVEKVMKENMHLPTFPLLPLVGMWCRLLANFRLDEANAAESVKHCSIPILFIHSTGDNFVPFRMTEEMKQNCASPCALHMVPDAPHGASYIVSPERCLAILKRFFTDPEATVRALAEENE